MFEGFSSLFSFTSVTIFFLFCGSAFVRSHCTNTYLNRSFSFKLFAIPLFCLALFFEAAVCILYFDCKFFDNRFSCLLSGILQFRKQHVFQMLQSSHCLALYRGEPGSLSTFSVQTDFVSRRWQLQRSSASMGLH